MGKQTFVIRLDEHVSRRLGQFLGSGAHGYASLDEFLQVALQNQLGIQHGGAEATKNPSVGTVDKDGNNPLLRQLNGPATTNLPPEGHSSTLTPLALTYRPR